MKPLADPESPTYFKKIVSIIISCDSLKIADTEKKGLFKEVKSIDKGPIQCSVNEESFTALDLYLLYSKGEFFSDDENFAEKLKEFKLNPISYQFLLYQFFSYSCDVYKVCGYLYHRLKRP